MLQQASFEVALLSLGGEGEKIEVVEVLDELLGEIGLGACERTWKLVVALPDGDRGYSRSGER